VAYWSEQLSQIENEGKDQLDATNNDLLAINYSSTCFGASLRPSSGEQSCVSLPMFFCSG
jgi:hypothetical protein